jgi:hypothetical protein
MRIEVTSPRADAWGVFIDAASGVVMFARADSEPIQ